MRRLLFVVAVGFTIIGSSADAQRIVGTVTRVDNGLPLAGAIVSVISQRGDTLTKVLTSTQGRFVAAPREVTPFTLVVRAIGLRPQRLAMGSVSSDSTATVDVRMETLTIQLSTITIRIAGLTECGSTREAGAEVMALWSEIATALELSQMAPAARPREYDYVSYTRTMSPNLRIRLGEKIDTARSLTERPVHAVSPDAIARGGYVLTSPNGVTYLAPSESVLLDERFIATHCFDVRRTDPNSRNNVGLEFRTVRGHTGIDIEGVFWVDRTTRELRKLRYNYTNLPLATVVPDLGGELDYARHAEGTFYITKWWVRMPALLGATRLTPRLAREMTRSVAEQGGEVIAVRDRGPALPVAAGRLTNLPGRAQIQRY